MARFFRGGIHPLGKKEITRKKPLIVPDIAPSHIILPLLDSTGEEMTPLVYPGEPVSIGGIVARPRKGETGAPMFSGISGVVSEITPQPHPLFEKTMSIVIENDYKNTRKAYPSFLDPDEISEQDIIGFFQERGLRGMSRDTRAVHEKVLEHRHKVDTLIINACESEPYLTSDYRLLLDRKDMVVAGGKLLAKGLGVKKIVVALQGDKLDAIEDLEKTLGWNPETMSVRTLPTRYPLGEEKQVIRYVTGKELKQEELCYNASCCVFNIATAYAVGEAVLKGHPQTHRSFTVTGGAVKRPRNFWLPIGTPLNAVLANADGVREPPAIALLGGPMSGIPQRDLCAPILVGSSGLVLMANWEVPNRLLKQSKSRFPCIHCGHCVTVCPKHLRPYLVHQYVNSPKKPDLQYLHPEECISCGCCNYRCPSHLHLSKSMETAKDLLLIQKLQKKLSVAVDDDVKIYTPKETQQSKESQRKESKLRVLVPMSDVDSSVLQDVFDRKEPSKQETEQSEPEEKETSQEQSEIPPVHVNIQEKKSKKSDISLNVDTELKEDMKPPLVEIVPSKNNDHTSDKLEVVIETSEETISEEIPSQETISEEITEIVLDTNSEPEQKQESPPESKEESVEQSEETGGNP